MWQKNVEEVLFYIVEESELVLYDVICDNNDTF